MDDPSRKIEHRINSMHKKTLKLVNKDSYDFHFKNCWLEINRFVFNKRTFRN